MDVNWEKVEARLQAQLVDALKIKNQGNVYYFPTAEEYLQIRTLVEAIELVHTEAVLQSLRDN
jgi:hypothetical protein